MRDLLPCRLCGAHVSYRDGRELAPSVRVCASHPATDDYVALWNAADPATRGPHPLDTFRVSGVGSCTENMTKGATHA